MELQLTWIPSFRGNDIVDFGVLTINFSYDHLGQRMMGISGDVLTL